MSRLNWNFEDLCEVIYPLTQNSSAPLSATDLNPAIKTLLERCPGSTIFGVGGHSAILSISEGVMAKVSLKADDPYHSNEQALFEKLDETPCPHIVQTFLRRPNITFMQPLRNGTLYDRMSESIPKDLALSWMLRIVTAVACLEAHGFVHGDINPRNILFDDEDQPKLVDLDHAMKIGEDLNVGYEPYVRCRCKGQGGGQYGIAGPVTEQLALGSILWYMTRGTELYYDLPGPEQVERLMNREFPTTNALDHIDSIISDCWLGKFGTIAHLLRRIQAVKTFDEKYQARKADCEEFYRQVLEGDKLHTPE